jgi:glucan phosphoethanolaminetransferase (alkaline phosphatase superfamily)
VLQNSGAARSGGFLLTSAKLVALVVLLAAAPWAWAGLFSETFDVFVKTNRLLFAAGYAVIFWTAIASLGIIPFLRNAYVRIPLVVMVTLAYAADQIFLGFTNYHLHISDVQIIWSGRGSWEGFSTYAAQFARDCMWVVAAGIILGLAPARNSALNLRWSSAPLAVVAIISAVIIHTKGSTEEFPSPFALPSMIGMVVANAEQPVEDVFSFGYGRTRLDPVEVNYDGPIRPLAKHIVFIVDESVRGDVLELNQPELDNTPFLAGQKDTVINFGVAVSDANCSMASRLMLKFGLRPDDFADSGLAKFELPSIWQYAHRAGYRTIMIDPFQNDKHSYALEWPSIDLYLPETDAATYARDGLIADRLVQLLKDDAPSFIYVNKYGVHNPYESAYPPGFHEIPVPGKRTLADWRGGAPRKALLDAYSNAVQWSVDGFFRKLLNRFDGGDVLVIYTSDHGQSLMDGGEKLSHCSTYREGSTQIGEGLVPLFALTKIPGLEERLRESAARAYGHAADFDIFPTLLSAMGYDEEWSRKQYGPSLLDIPANRRRRFLIMNGVGTRSWFNDAKWVTVD